MKKTFLLVFIIIVSSCNHNEEKLTAKKEILEKENDSLTELISKTENNVGMNFTKLLEQETQTESDSTLIPEYKNLLGENEIFDIYIWDRIQTISNLNSYNQIVSEFSGTYRLKPIYNDKYADVNLIKIKNDSCFLFKNKELIVSEKLKIRNSSNKNIKGIIYIKNFGMTLHSSGFGTGIFLKDRFCMDCERLDYYKTK
ncbi:hypothetical protein [Olleya sp. 1-3]|uniref:hypothetical protein n=1 Tax=Olleya sp. 1-3 TaxID=2058323 RepID=UPI000C327C8C|nr:hypothetical protein [Olleya sp. 1-3]PKG51445.1 hypothetical protein CXF54_08550 [Olleya sp. 1-3]